MRNTHFNLNAIEINFSRLHLQMRRIESLMKNDVQIFDSFKMGAAHNKVNIISIILVNNDVSESVSQDIHTSRGVLLSRLRLRNATSHCIWSSLPLPSLLLNNREYAMPCQRTCLFICVCVCIFLSGLTSSEINQKHIRIICLLIYIEWQSINAHVSFPHSVCVFVSWNGESERTCRQFSGCMYISV